jgi:hypothetical protein
MQRKQPTQQQQQEADEWNNWKPGSGRKGWSPFTRPAPPVRDGATGHPLKDGKIDWEAVIRKANQDG